MKLNNFVYLVFFTIISLSIMVLVNSQTYGEQDAEIIEFYVYPETPIIDETAEITIKIRNTGVVRESFKVNFYVLTACCIKMEKNFEVNPKPDETWMEIEEFTPDSLGIHKFRVEVWDSSEIRILDANTIDVMVRGDVGPFDASVDVITTYPYPGKEVFANVNLLNKGTKEVDVSVNYEIEGTGISGRYMVAPESESESSKVISMPAPEEPGIYELSVEVDHEGSPVASAHGNFYVESKEYIPVLEIQGVPFAIEAAQGESKSFSIKVSNIGNFTVSKLHLIVQGISSKWVDVWPSYADLMPDESRIYLAKFQIPEETNIETYPVEFIAAGKETYKSEPSALTISEASLTESIGEISVSPYRFLNILGYALGITVLIAIVVVSRLKQTVSPKIEMPKEIIEPKIPPIIRNLANLDVHDQWRDNGLAIGLDFIDDKGKNLSFRNVKMYVTVTLFTVKTDPHTSSKEKSRIVHKGSVIADTDSDLDLSRGGGLLIPKEEINVYPGRDEQYGILEITVRTPEGRGFFAKDEFVKLY